MSTTVTSAVARAIAGGGRDRRLAIGRRARPRPLRSSRPSDRWRRTQRPRRSGRSHCVACESFRRPATAAPRGPVSVNSPGTSSTASSATAAASARRCSAHAQAASPHTMQDCDHGSSCWQMTKIGAAGGRRRGWKLGKATRRHANRRDSTLKQFVDLVLAGVDQRERPALRAGQLRFQIEAQAVVDRGHDFRRLDGPLGRHAADAIAAADDAAALARRRRRNRRSSTAASGRGRRPG